MLPGPRIQALPSRRALAAIGGSYALGCLALASLAACGSSGHHARDRDEAPRKHSQSTDAGESESPPAAGCPDGIYEGSVYIETASDLAVLRGCTRLVGDLTVSSESLSNLKGLEALQTIEGVLQIGPTWSGSSDGADTQFDRFNSLTGLERLRSVQALSLSSIGIESLAELESLESAPVLAIVHVDGLEDLSGLDNVAWDRAQFTHNARLQSLSGLRVPESATSLELSDNPMLSSVSTLAGLREVDQLVLQNLEALKSFDGLGELQQIKSELRITHCDAVGDLSGLGCVAPTLTITDNAELTTLRGRGERGAPRTVLVANNPKLVDVAGLLGASDERLDSLLLMQLPALQTISDLSPLREVGDLAIHTCISLSELSGLDNIQRLSSLSIVASLNLQSLNGLSSLERVDAGLYLNNVPEVASLQGMTKLQSLGNLFINSLTSLPDLHGLEAILELDGIEIAANPALTSFAGLEHLERANTVLVANNPSLASLDGLSALASVRALQVSANMSLASLRGLTALTSAGTLALTGNRNLPQCEVDWLAKRVKLPTPAGQNGPTGMCSP